MAEPISTVSWRRRAPTTRPVVSIRSWESRIRRPPPTSAWPVSPSVSYSEHGVTHPSCHRAKCGLGMRRLLQSSFGDSAKRAAVQRAGTV